MRLYEFLYITNNFDTLWNFLCQKGVVRNQIVCPRCQNILILHNNAENHIFHCKKRYYKIIKGRKRQKTTCNFKISAFHGTWFERMHLDLLKVCRFIAYFVIIPPPRQKFLMKELDLNSEGVVDWTNFCRELLQQWVEQKQEPIGGIGKVVEIDEAKIGKRKYNTGRLIRGQWVLGIDRDSKQVFILPVQDRRAETLLPIIRQYVKSGSVIHTDKWRAYDALSNENYTHHTVNHSTNFVDPETGVHTQNIERLWRDMRANIPHYSIRDYHFTHYIAEFLYKRKYDYNERIEGFFEIMKFMYPLDI